MHKKVAKVYILIKAPNGKDICERFGRLGKISYEMGVRLLRAYILDADGCQGFAWSELDGEDGWMDGGSVLHLFGCGWAK